MLVRLFKMPAPGAAQGLRRGAMVFPGYLYSEKV